MIKLNKISRLLASYIDFAIVMNLLMLVSTLANMLETKEIRLAISIFFDVAIFSYFVCKDSIFENASIGKHLLGLKLIKPSSIYQNDLGTNIRNMISSLAILLFIIYDLSARSFEGYIVLLIYMAFNAIFFCYKPNKKLGDYLAKLEVVEDEDNTIWKEVAPEKKNAYITIVSFLLSLPIIDVLVKVSPIIFRMGWGFSEIKAIIRGAIPIAGALLIFHFYNKLINKFVDNALLKKLLVICAASVMLAAVAKGMLDFSFEVRWLFR